ncbi:hypothetical protein [Streptomyces europaeiscabiei]
MRQTDYDTVYSADSGKPPDLDLALARKCHGSTRECFVVVRIEGETQSA